MKAVRVLRYGPASVVEIDDVPKPSPGRGQVLVRVEAAGVGNWDALFREGESRLEPLPIILGSDISGTVEALGAEASGFKPGDEVYGGRTGAAAQYVSVPQDRAFVRKPANVTFEQAAAVPVAAVTLAPSAFAICTAKVPTPPDAPLISARCPRSIRPFRRP